MSRAKEWKDLGAADFQNPAAQYGGDGVDGGSSTNGRDTPSTPSTPYNTEPKLADTALYGPAGDIVRKIEPHTESHPAALLLQLLVGIGNLIGRMPFMFRERDRHPTNLYTLIVGATAKGRKGTGWGHVRYFLSLIEPLWESSRIMGGLASGEGVVSELRDPEEGEEDQQKDKRLLLFEGEFGGVLRVMQKEGVTLSAIMRTAWDTGLLRNLANKNRDRKGSSLRASGCHVSLIAHITQEELTYLLSQNDASNGFANRILFCHSARTKLLPHGGNIQSEDFSQELRKLQDAVSFARRHGEFQHSAEARAYWETIYPELTKDVPGRLGQVTSRAEAQVIRLSLIFCLLDSSREIKVEHVRAAEALWNYCSESARWAFKENRFSPHAQRLFNALAIKSRTLEEIGDVVFNKNLKKEQIQAALNELRDFIVTQEQKTAGRSATVVSLKEQAPPL